MTQQTRFRVCLHQEGLDAGPGREIYMSVFTAALLTTAKRQTQRKCPRTGKRNAVYPHAGILHSRKKGGSCDPRDRMDGLEDITLRETSPSQTTTTTTHHHEHWVVPFPGGAWSGRIAGDRKEDGGCRLGGRTAGERMGSCRLTATEFPFGKREAVRSSAVQVDHAQHDGTVHLAMVEVANSLLCVSFNRNRKLKCKGRRPSLV